MCQGLFQYCSARQDGPDDIKALWNSLEGLIRPLDVLGRIVKDDGFDRASRAYVESYLSDCDDTVKDLSRGLEEVRKEAPSG
jgi:hypothetical protein